MKLVDSQKMAVNTSRQKQKEQASSLLSSISPFLKEADKLVKEGNLERALTIVRQAFQTAPGNLYVLAYEANVLSLIEKKKKSQQSPAEKEESNEKLKQLAQVTIEDINRTEKLAQTIITTREELKQEFVEREKETKKREETIKSRLAQFLVYAKNLAKEKKFSQALDEINRAFLINPLSQEVADLETTIRKEFDEELAKQKTEQVQMEREEKELIRKVQTSTVLPVTIDPKIASQVESLIKEGKRFAQLGEFENALIVLQKGLSLNPTHTLAIDLHQRIMKSLEEQRNIQKEIDRQKFAAQKKAFEENNKKIESMLHNAAQHISRGEFNVAITILNEIDRLNPQSKEAHQLRQKIHQAQLETIEAIQTQTILPEDSVRKKQQEIVARTSEKGLPIEGDIELMYRMEKAIAYYKQCRFEDALGELAIILVQNPKHVEAITLRNIVTESQQNLQQSLHEQILQTKEQENNQKQKKILLEESMKKIYDLRNKKLYSEALDEITKGMVIDPLNETLVKLEQELRNERDEYAKSIETTEPSIAKHQFLDALRNAQKVLANSGYMSATEGIPTEETLRDLGKELKKKLKQKH